MKKSSLKYNGMLLITAIIWGSAFVFQREGAASLGPFLFGAIRYALGALVVIPALFWPKEKARKSATSPGSLFSRKTCIAGILIGFFLFAGTTLQQAGLSYTTAGKAGFITESYVVLVPLISLMLGDKQRINTWLGVVLVIFGLYLLSNNSLNGFNRGDWFELAGAILWAAQVLLIDRFAPGLNAFALSFIQFLACAIFSLAGAIIYEPFILVNIKAALIPLIYTGVFSSGVAFTLQVVAQQKTPATHAALIMSLEAIFAALAGWWLLDETMTTLAVTGCLIMLLGILLAQINVFRIFAQRKKYGSTF